MGYIGPRKIFRSSRDTGANMGYLSGNTKAVKIILADQKRSLFNMEMSGVLDKVKKYKIDIDHYLKTGEKKIINE